MQFKTTPFQHQRECLDCSIDKPYFAIFADMGTGKSKIAIDTICNLFVRNQIDSAIIVAPKGCYLNWIEQFKIHSSIPFWMHLYTGVPVYNGDNPAPQTVINIYLINTEAVITKDGSNFIRKSISPTTMLVIDESTKIKNPKSKRTKELTKISKITQYKRILTGYPAPNNIIDLYSQFMFLGEEILKCKSWYAFRNTFCQLQEVYLGGNRPTFHRITGTQNLDILQQRIAPFSFRIKKEDCLDLPDKVYTKHEFSMSKEQQLVYQEFRATAIAKLSDGTTISVANTINMLLKLQTIACGYVYDENNEIHRFKENPRLQCLLDLVETLMAEGQKIIIWSHSVQCIKDLEDALVNAYDSESIGTYYGGTADELRHSNAKNFQDRKGILKILIANPSVAGFGLTLTTASTAIYYSNSYNLEHRLQSEDRIHRIGQLQKCLYIDLAARGSVDNKIIKNLRDKKKLGDTILGDEWKEWI